MKLQNHWIKDITEAIEEIGHGEFIQKFVAVDKGESDISVEIHGFVTRNGEFIIASEKFERKKEHTNG